MLDNFYTINPDNKDRGFLNVNYLTLLVFKVTDDFKKINFG